MASAFVDHNQRDKIRFAVGLFLAMAIPLSFPWTLAYITPVFAAILLRNGGPFMGLKMAAILIVILGLAVIVGSILSHTVIHLPGITFMLIALIVFHIYHYAAGQGSPIISLLALVGVVLLPFLALISAEISSKVGLSIFGSGSFAIILVCIMYGLLPGPDGNTGAKPVKEKPHPVLQLRSTIISSLIAVPMIFLFYLGQLNSDAVVLIMIIILAQNPALEAGVKGSIMLIAGNILGGICALVYYNFMIIAPNYLFLLLSLMVICLIFANAVLSGSPLTPVYQNAITAFFILSYPILTSDAGGLEKTITRIVHIMIVGIYIVGISSLLHWLYDRSTYWRQHKYLVRQDA